MLRSITDPIPGNNTATNRYRHRQCRLQSQNRWGDSLHPGNSVYSIVVIMQVGNCNRRSSTDVPAQLAVGNWSVSRQAEQVVRQTASGTSRLINIPVGGTVTYIHANIAISVTGTWLTLH
jgi:hypothetical protein